MKERKKSLPGRAKKKTLSDKKKKKKLMTAGTQSSPAALCPSSLSVKGLPVQSNRDSRIPEKTGGAPMLQHSGLEHSIFLSVCLFDSGLNVYFFLTGVGRTHYQWSFHERKIKTNPTSGKTVAIRDKY